MTSERSKRRDFLSLIFIAKSIPKKLLLFIIYINDLPNVPSLTQSLLFADATSILFP